MKIKELVETLQEEFSGFERLAITLRAKRDTIEKNDVDGLKKILVDERAILDDLDLLEQKRIALAGEISKEIESGSTISDIIKAVDEPYRHDLAILVAKLTSLINEVSLLNLGIQRMIAYRLEEFDFIMELFKDNDKTYDKQNHLPDGIMFTGRA